MLWLLRAPELEDTTGQADGDQKGRDRAFQVDGDLDQPVDELVAEPAKGHRRDGPEQGGQDIDEKANIDVGHQIAP